MRAELANLKSLSGTLLKPRQKLVLVRPYDIHIRMDNVIKMGPREQ